MRPPNWHSVEPRHLCNFLLGRKVAIALSPSSLFCMNLIFVKYNSFAAKGAHFPARWGFVQRAYSNLNNSHHDNTLVYSCTSFNVNLSLAQTTAMVLACKHQVSIKFTSKIRLTWKIFKSSLHQHNHHASKSVLFPAKLVPIKRHVLMNIKTLSGPNDRERESTRGGSALSWMFSATCD